MNETLKGSRALVCGSTQGIGKAIAIKLAALGAHITLIARNEDKLKHTLQELSTSNFQNHDYLVADFQNPSNLKSVLDQYIKGKTIEIDILINNTGGPKGGKAIDALPEEYINAFNMHLVCNHILTQAVVPGMIKNSYGRIINIVSTSVKMPIPGLGVSNTIRGAVASWSKTLSFELGSRGITVNNVLPGSTNTSRIEALISTKVKKSDLTHQQMRKMMEEEIPAGRFAEPEEIATAVAFLASKEASYINGINLAVDGGKIGCL